MVDTPQPLEGQKHTWPAHIERAMCVLAIFLISLTLNGQKITLKLQDILNFDQMVAINNGFDEQFEAHFAFSENYLIVSDHGLNRENMLRCDVDDYPGTFLFTYDLNTKSLIDSIYLEFSSPISTISDIYYSNKNLYIISSNELLVYRSNNFPNLNTIEFQKKINLEPFNIKYPRIYPIGSKELRIIHDQISFPIDSTTNKPPRILHLDLYTWKIKENIILPQNPAFGLSSYSHHTFYCGVGSKVLFSNGIEYEISMLMDSGNYKNTVKFPLENKINFNDLISAQNESNIFSTVKILRGTNSIKRINPIYGDTNHFLVDVSLHNYEPNSYMSIIDLWEIDGNRISLKQNDYIHYPIRLDSAGWMNNRNHYFHWSCSYKISGNYLIMYSNQYMNNSIREYFLSSDMISLDDYFTERTKLIQEGKNTKPCVFVYKIIKD